MAYKGAFFLISILQSSIKTSKQQGKVLNIIGFQFYKVRLKQKTKRSEMYDL